MPPVPIPGKFFKSSYYLMKDNKMCDEELILKPILELMFDILFLYERHKPEKKSKESTSQRDASQEGDIPQENEAGEGEQKSKEIDDEPFIPMNKHEMDIIELKEHIGFSYAPTLSKNNQLSALIRI